ncbi:division/cell wall cluster transcriptional repressor MraZ [Paraferrimonas haliotis]|uniref:division/cell wall cluster transcriptional repressor MraZ n=1 Tax=Paraferrimonas haliotis TaxID=2013866 RepID=UPI000BA8EE6B|nr:division/cell wall cluster transcriptional repressor MraZ [Paraferrimonas haliotis]
MFSGATNLQIDAKGRLAMPTRHRPQLQQQCCGRLVCTVDFQSRCLLLYPEDQWQVVAEKLMKLSDTQPIERAMKRMLLGHAQECNMDKNGRLLIPASLRTFAELDKAAVLIGQLNKFELWNEALWQQQLDDSMQALQSADLSDSQRLQDFSL